MAKAGIYKRYVSVTCPACRDYERSLRPDDPPSALDGLHRVPFEGEGAWQFNGDVESPTLAPSLLLTHGSFGDQRQKYTCHSFIRNGQIQYLGDCTHALAGQTIDLPEHLWSET